MFECIRYSNAMLHISFHILATFHAWFNVLLNGAIIDFWKKQVSPSIRQNETGWTCTEPFEGRPKRDWFLTQVPNFIRRTNVSVGSTIWFGTLNRPWDEWVNAFVDNTWKQKRSHFQCSWEVLNDSRIWCFPIQALVHRWNVDKTLVNEGGFCDSPTWQ